MTDLSDILSCDQLDAAVAQQQQYVGSLGWKVARAAADTNAQGRKVKAAVDLYNEFKTKISNEISETKAMLDNTPKEVKTGGPLGKKINPDWQELKDNLDKLTQRRESKLQELQTNVDVERGIEQNLKDAEDKLTGELKRAQQDLEYLKDAASRCHDKKKSKLAGAILIGAGVGLAVLGWTFMAPQSSPEPSKNVANAQPAMTADAPPTDAVTPQPAPVTSDTPVNDDGFKVTAPAKQHKTVANAPLGDERPAESHANETQRTSDDHGTTEERDGHDVHVSTGDESAVGNDGGEHYETGGEHEESSHDYSYEVEHEGGDSRESGNEEPYFPGE